MKTLQKERKKMAMLLANHHNLIERLLSLQKETLKDLNESICEDKRIPLSWDIDNDLSMAINSMHEASKTVSDCATKLVLVLIVSNL